MTFRYHLKSLKYSACDLKMGEWHSFAQTRTRMHDDKRKKNAFTIILIGFLSSRMISLFLKIFRMAQPHISRLCSYYSFVFWAWSFQLENEIPKLNITVKDRRRVLYHIHIFLFHTDCDENKVERHAQNATSSTRRLDYPWSDDIMKIFNIDINDIFDWPWIVQWKWNICLCID